ncbi:MAG: hypothetical protein J5I53_08945 [Bradyrhizobiaceae bacterium]|nr:hypothetical protein [Bradyrhizobiaceae bacterium]
MKLHVAISASLIAAAVLIVLYLVRISGPVINGELAFRFTARNLVVQLYSMSTTKEDIAKYRLEVVDTASQINPLVRGVHDYNDFRQRVMVATISDVSGWSVSTTGGSIVEGKWRCEDTQTISGKLIFHIVFPNVQVQDVVELSWRDQLFETGTHKFKPGQGI